MKESRVKITFIARSVNITFLLLLLSLFILLACPAPLLTAKTNTERTNEQKNKDSNLVNPHHRQDNAQSYKKTLLSHSSAILGSPCLPGDCMRSPSSSFLSAVIVCVLAATHAIIDKLRPDVLLIGNVTIDVVNGNHTLGGAVSYAAAVVNQLGKSTCVVTAAGANADFSMFERHRLSAVNGSSTLTFQHSYTWWGHKRVLHVTAIPDVTLGVQHVPLWCRLSRVVLLGPLLPSDLDANAFTKMRSVVKNVFKQDVGLMAQGFQRELDSSKKVVSLKAPHENLLAALRPGVSVFLSDVETDPWTEADFQEVVRKSERLIVTKGEKGADEYQWNHTRSIPVEKVEAVDTNGAGDTFATAYMLALSSGSSNPGRNAALAAACTVTKPQGPMGSFSASNSASY